MKFKTTKYPFICLLMFLLAGNALFAQTTRKIGTTSAAFLRIPVSSRAAGMGNAFTAMKPDASSLYWNPSGAAYLSEYNVIFDHANWLADLQFNYAGIVIPVPDNGSVGISATVLSTPAMLVTTPAEPMGTGETFDAVDLAFALSYARSLTDKFAIGANVKYVNERIYNTTASGIAFDIGTIYESPFYGVRIGAAISNFGTKMKMDGEDLNVRVDIAPGQEGNNQSITGRLNTDEFEMPLIMRIGLSGEILQTDNIRISFDVEGVNPNDNSQSVNIGFEAAFIKELFLIRAGYNDLFLPETEAGISCGAGVNRFNLYDNLFITSDFSYQKFNRFGGITRFTIYLLFH